MIQVKDGEDIGEYELEKVTMRIIIAHLIGDMSSLLSSMFNLLTTTRRLFV